MATQSGETPLLDLLASMTANSLESTSLDPRSLMLVRIAALVAMDAPPASYMLNLGAAGELGVTADEVEGLLAGRSHRWHHPDRLRRRQAGAVLGP